MLSTDTRQMLQQYVDGNVSNGELGAWLAASEYDSALVDERDRLAELRLIVVEEAEGRRSDEHVLNAVAAILAAEKPERHLLTKRTSASTTWERSERLTAAVTRVRRAGI